MLHDGMVRMLDSDTSGYKGQIGHAGQQDDEFFLERPTTYYTIATRECIEECIRLLESRICTLYVTLHAGFVSLGFSVAARCLTPRPDLADARTEVESISEASFRD